MSDYFKYRFSDGFEFYLNEKDFVSIVGNSNDFIINTLLYGNPKCNIFVGDLELNKKNMPTIRKRISFVLFKHLNVYVGETVMDEIAFGLESLAYTKDDILNLIDSESRTFKIDHLLEKDPNSLGASDRCKMKILSALIVKPNMLIIDNVLNELDYEDKILVFKILKEYKNNGGIVVNFTNDMEETLHSDKIYVIYDNKIACEGKTMSVLNEERLLKRLGLGLPFIVELNKYLMNYDLITKYYLTNEKLVNALWK